MGSSHRIGFFLHIPFPPADLLVTLSSHEALVRGLFAYDLVGFQTDADLRAFQDYVLNEVGGVLHGDGSLEAFGRDHPGRRLSHRPRPRRVPRARRPPGRRRARNGGCIAASRGGR